jgi:hypothetical protein
VGASTATHIACSLSSVASTPRPRTIVTSSTGECTARALLLANVRAIRRRHSVKKDAGLKDLAENPVELYDFNCNADLKVNVRSRRIVLCLSKALAVKT